MIRPTFTLLLALTTCLPMLSACSDDESEPRGAEVLRIGYSALRISLPVFVAKERGLFEEHGLDIELKRYETAQPLVEEVLDERVLAGGFAALPIVFTAASRDAAEVRLALGMVEDAAHPVSSLLRRAGDTSISSVSDLRGKTVGILPTVAYRHWLEAMLVHAGVPLSEVSIVALAPPQQTAALEHGGVDALFTNDPMATATVESGVGVSVGDVAPVTAVSGGSLVFGSFLVSPRLARERPRVVGRLLRALDEATRLIHEDQRAARQAMVRYVRAPERPYVARYPDARYLTSAEFDDGALSGAVQSMVDLGVLPGPRDVSGWTLRAERPAAP